MGNQSFVKTVTPLVERREWHAGLLNNSTYNFYDHEKVF